VIVILGQIANIEPGTPRIVMTAAMIGQIRRRARTGFPSEGPDGGDDVGCTGAGFFRLGFFDLGFLIRP
jgi:hypothetical protein